MCARIMSMNRILPSSRDLRKKWWVTFSVIPITCAIGLLFLLEAQDYMDPNPNTSVCVETPKHNLQSILRYWHSRSMLQQDPITPTVSGFVHDVAE